MDPKLVFDFLIRYFGALLVGGLLRVGIEKGTAEWLGPAIGAALLWGIFAFLRNTQLAKRFPSWFTDAQAVQLSDAIKQGSKTIEAGKVKDPKSEIGSGETGNTL